MKNKETKKIIIKSLSDNELANISGGNLKQTAESAAKKLNPEQTLNLNLKHILISAWCIISPTIAYYLGNKRGFREGYEIGFDKGKLEQDNFWGDILKNLFRSSSNTTEHPDYTTNHCTN